MNEKVQEILDVMKGYIENLIYKNEKNLIKDDVIEKLFKIANELKNIDLSIKSYINSTMKEQIYNQIQDLFEYYMDKFVENLPTEKIEKEVDTDEFFNSNEYEQFKKEALEILIKALDKKEITDEEYNEILDEFNIKISNTDLNEIISKITKPKPSKNPPPGQKWVWDADAEEWILMAE